MIITRFEIVNFKGIKKTAIDIPAPGSNSIVSLIGLNESGKTTILQAISEFISNDQSLASLYRLDASEGTGGQTLQAESKMVQLVPKHLRAKFSDEIKICALVQLNETDKDRLVRYLKAFGAQIDKASIPSSFRICQVHKFDNTKHTASHSTWDFKLKGKFGKQRTLRNITHAEHRDTWLKAITWFRLTMPKVCYFPSFLFDLPEKIYLCEHEGETTVNELYRGVLQDVLDSRGDGLNIKEQVLERIKPKEETEGWGTCWSKFQKSEGRYHVDDVLSKLANHLGQEIFSAWNEIFGRKFEQKRFALEIDSDPEKDGLPFVRFMIFDGPTRYFLNERSLGFRWFFSFLLFTKFRAAGGGRPTIFLFDEPASNLHAKAQIQLLRGFSGIAGDACSILFSTHSLYLIDPARLEFAYIVDNAALDFDKDAGEGEFKETHTDITAIKYRAFVGKYASRTSYYQPVLDRLHAVQSPMQFPDDVVIFEGKSDFYFFEFYKRKYGKKDVCFFPGTGASGADNLISLGLGMGRNFLVLCDDDKAGREARKRYRAEYCIGDRAITFGDLGADYEGFMLESILSQDVSEDIKSKLGAAKLTKQSLSAFFAEKCNTLEFELDAETKQLAEKILDNLQNKLTSLKLAT